jgi:hypothetical protein
MDTTRLAVYSGVMHLCPDEIVPVVTFLGAIKLAMYLYYARVKAFVVAWLRRIKVLPPPPCCGSCEGTATPGGELSGEDVQVEQDVS